MKNTLLSLLMLTTLSIADTFDQAVEAYKAGNFKTALPILKRLSQNNHPEAQYLLAYMYDRAIGVEHNLKEAVRLYKNAAGKNNADAQYTLATMYLQGYGTRRDVNRGRDLLIKAKKNNHPKADELMKIWNFE